jgi:redox-sensitive bicupin YhaK (pirin superfamily)
MMTIRRSEDRGRADHGWLVSRFTFSFSDYYDPAHMGFRDLRVINEDRVQAGTGFGRHSHRDMEILTWPLSGALEHRDSMGNSLVVQHGEIQRMSAGTGIVHSEMNGADDAVHFLQIWIRPERAGITPSYEQRSIPIDVRNRLHEAASHDPIDGGVKIHQNAALYIGVIEPGTSISHGLAPGRHAWVQVARGRVDLNGKALLHGDGAAMSDEARLEIRADEESEVLVFDLA